MPDMVPNTNPPTGPDAQGVSTPAQVVDTQGKGSNDVQMPQPASAAQAVLGRAQNAPAPATQTPSAGMIPQQAPQAMEIDPRLARNAQTGAAFHAFMGTHGEVGPNGTIEQSPNTAGQLFRSILAGAITGMAQGPKRRWAEE